MRGLAYPLTPAPHSSPFTERGILRKDFINSKKRRDSVMSQKKYFRLFWVLLVLLGFVVWSGDLAAAPKEGEDGYEALKRKYVKGEYPAPRFPSYMKPVKTIDEVMPFARAAVRQTGGRTPLGLANPGQTVLIVTEPGAEPLLLQGIKKAYEERGVKLIYMPSWELVGVSESDGTEVRKIREMASESHMGHMESYGWTNNWVDPQVPRMFIKERRPDLYEKIFKAAELSDEMKVVEAKMTNFGVAKGIIKYLDAHPEIGVLFWGTGGRTAMRRLLLHHEAKFYSNFIFDKQHMLMSRVPAFPGDLWRLAEERTIEPIAWVDKMHVYDPEGTDMRADISQEDAEAWAKGVYQQGHLFMLPDIATGRFPYSVLEYPAIIEGQGKYLAALQTEINGVTAGCSGHWGMFPRMEIHRKKGVITEIKDGGIYGEVMREFFNNYAKMRTLQYPYLKKPGWWWLHEIGLGTNPKFMLVKGDVLGERNHAGVIHWGTGLRVYHDPKKPLVPTGWEEFCKTEKVPFDHNWHVHNILCTYRVKIRGTDKWLNLINKGRLTSLDDPMVRALASRYGDPDDLLGDEWVPHFPGINAPGSYAGFAKEPFKFYMENVYAKIQKGTYEYFYTPPSMRKKK
jgi:hypothetical protein